MATPEKLTLRYVDLPATDILEGDISPQELELLGRVSRRVGGLKTLEAVMDYLFETLQSVLPCDRIGLAFIEDNGLRVVAHHAVAAYEPLRLGRGYAEALEGSSLERVIRQGEPRILNDLPRYLEEHPGSRSTRMVVAEGLRSSITCPLEVDGQNVGLLFLSSHVLDAYTEKHLGVFRLLVERLSQVVEAAYRAEQLQKAIAAYFEMLGFVVHELRSPVASIVMDARLMLDGYIGDLTGEQKDKLRRMIAKSEYLLGLVREYLDLARVESGDLAPEWAEVKDLMAEVVEPSVEIVLPQVEEKGMALEREVPGEPVALTGDPGLLKTVFVNLLGNAAKYGRDKGRIRIRLTAGPREVEIGVWNEGPGFPEDQKHLLFRKFSRIRTEELLKRKGTGVGLYTTWRIVRLHGGSIRAESRLGEWAEFTVRLPRRPPAAAPPTP